MIELCRLAKTYPDGTRGLHPLDLTIERGVLGVLGPNGAGKTTLLSMLVLAVEPSAGSRRYFGLDDSPKHRPALRASIGYLPQEYRAVPAATGLQYLMLCGRARGLPLHHRELRARVEAMLELVDLTNAAHRATSEYSGGMRRRLGLAQALLHRPRLLVVDEPTAGLDPEERIRFRNIITDAGDQLPVVHSTHIVEDIEATSSRLAILCQGELIFDGAPEDLLECVRGRVWPLPECQAGDAPVLGHRRFIDKQTLDRAMSDRAAEPNLEEAYATFLAGCARSALATKPTAEA